MPRKKPSPFIRRVKGADELKTITAELRKEGFEPYNAFSLPKVMPDTSGTAQSWADVISAQLRHGAPETGKRQRAAAPTRVFSSGNEIKSGVGDIGTQGLGYIEWGFGNTLPNIIAILTQMSAYTAPGAKFNTDMLAGLGPQPKYDVTQYVGGNIVTTTIRYKDAGMYILGQIADCQKKLYKLTLDHRQAMKEGDTANADGDDGFMTVVREATSSSPADEAFDALCKNIKDEIEALKHDYEVWQTTDKEVREFVENNNLQQVWLGLGIDMVMYNIAFPEILLNLQDLDSNGHPVASSAWQPKAVGLSYRTCHTTRLERMDDNGVINYVYNSNRWLDSPFVEDQTSLQSDEIIAIPALNIMRPLQSLRNTVRKAREQNVAVANRPTRFVLPSVYPTAGRPYYPTPAWHSIFGGDIYEYLSTTISDRLTRKRNSNIIGRVIYMNHDYLRMLALQADEEGNAKGIEQIRDDFFNRINTWLSNRSNAGQSLLAFTFQGSDGKEHRSFEVVEIESASNDNATANEKETAEISSIIFMAMGLDSRLIGSSPLSLVSSSGGTDIRERFLLRQILASPTQNILLKSLDVISHFNEWDPHLKWDISREVMTTLDNSKTGVTEAETE